MEIRGVKSNDLKVRFGFALVELLIVVAIIGILAATSVSLFVGWRADTRNGEVVAQVERSLSQARQDAKRLSSDVVVEFVDGATGYEINGATVALPPGTTISTPDGGNVIVGFASVLGVQEPFETVQLDVTTGNGVFERTVRIAVIPPLGKTSVVR